MQYHRSPAQPVVEPIIQASVSHFIIFNPLLKRPPPPPSPTKSDNGEKERDRDLEDDLKEASQILFYTSREGGKVSRDKMLRQFGLVKGLMGFTDMVLENQVGEVKGWWGVHSQKSRMVIWTPEEGFYIYINVTLPHKANGEAVHGSQGISDQIIIEGLKRGYEDYRLLHGPLTNLDHSSTTTSANLERFWTRFAFQFESTYLSPGDAGSLLPTWLGGYPTPPHERVKQATGVIDTLLEHGWKEGTIAGLITRDGPIHTSQPIPDSMARYLINALPLPPPVVTISTPISADRSSLGLGFGLGLRKKPKVPASTAQEDNRQSSWTSWVPTMSSTGAKEDTVKEEGTSRWPSFGLSSLGMGTMFGSDTKQDQVSVRNVEIPVKADEETRSIASSHLVEQSEVVLTDLEAAVNPDAEIELVWEKKDIWLEGADGDHVKRRLSWIIRDDKLLFIVFPPDSTPPFEMPPTSATLAVFASLPDVTIRSSVDSSRSATAQPQNCHIHRMDDRTDTQIGMDAASSVTLLELRDQLILDPSVHEIYAKSSTGKFLVASKQGTEEMYMQVGKKDASLTDAEQAIKSFRAHLVACDYRSQFIAALDTYVKKDVV